MSISPTQGSETLPRPTQDLIEEYITRDEDGLSFKEKFPSISSHELLTALMVLLPECIEKNDAKKFLALFEEFSSALDTQDLKWLVNSPAVTKDFANAITDKMRKLRKEEHFSRAELLMKVCMKLGIKVRSDMSTIDPTVDQASDVLKTLPTDRGPGYDRS
ncbi:MAG: hypothetical protein Q8P56_04640 [Candidatus Uhrbacteria bacterium]|nr:hypothetical protein [Candidatus Uhrbacteria bacterium]